MKWEHANQLVFRETESDYEIICECKEEYAPLIAAAPDLLAACKEALENLSYEWDVSSVEKKLNAAIHKAEATS